MLGLVATGMSNAEIAEQLVVAPCTVRKHLENAYRKLGVTNRLAAMNALEGGTESTSSRASRSRRPPAGVSRERRRDDLLGLVLHLGEVSAPRNDSA